MAEGKQEKLNTTRLLVFACGPFFLLSLAPGTRQVGGLESNWPPSAYSFFFFFIAASDQPLRLGETLHLVREEILLSPSMIPDPPVFFFCCCCWRGDGGGRVAAAAAGIVGPSTTPPSCLPPPPCSLCFSNHAADVPDG